MLTSASASCKPVRCLADVFSNGKFMAWACFVGEYREGSAPWNGGGVLDLSLGSVEGLERPG